jgi:Methyltransferase domain
MVELLCRKLGYSDIDVVDTSVEAVGLAESFGAHGKLVGDTVDFLRGKGIRYRAVLMFHVLEHVPKNDVVDILTAIHDSLCEDGILLLEVPNMGDPLNGLYYRYADFTHECGFTEESLSYVLKLAGFQDLKYLESLGAASAFGRSLQQLGRRISKSILFCINLPNGRQMSRQTGPFLSVVAKRQN